MTQAIAITAARVSRELPQGLLRFWRERPRELARFVRARPYEVLVAGGVALAGVVSLGGSAGSTPTLSGLPVPGRAGEVVGPPAPPPLLVRRLPPEQAVAINAAIPLAQEPNPAAKPFILGKADKTAQARALECLASAVYYEAGSEDVDGQRAVAQVVLNRVRHPAFPSSVCGVVYEGSTRPTGCQFTFTCDGSLMRRPSLAGWRRAIEVAQAALAGFVYKPVGNATHYHANYVVPYWAPTLIKNAVIGAHIFYRWAGGWGRPAAFVQRYARSEPNVQALRTAAILAEQREEQLKALQGPGSVAAIVAEVPGAEELKLKPSMRGDQRVAIRFNLAARKAAEEAPREEYLEKVRASDNLRWTITGAASSAEERPLGKAEGAAGTQNGAAAAGAGGASAALPAGAAAPISGGGAGSPQ
jgi:spore germination cell wall hydrolase CwlJ-like protein